MGNNKFIPANICSLNNLYLNKIKYQCGIFFIKPLKTVPN